MLRDDGIQYFTSEDIATYFDVAPNTVNKWKSRGFLTPAKKIKQGRNTVNLYTEAEVKAFAQRKYGHTP